MVLERVSNPLLYQQLQCVPFHLYLILPTFYFLVSVGPWVVKDASNNKYSHLVSLSLYVMSDVFSAAPINSSL